MFWGREQFAMVRLRLNDLGFGRAGRTTLTDIAYPWRTAKQGRGWMRVRLRRG